MEDADLSDNGEKKHGYVERDPTWRRKQSHQSPRPATNFVATQLDARLWQLFLKAVVQYHKCSEDEICGRTLLGDKHGQIVRQVARELNITPTRSFMNAFQANMSVTEAMCVFSRESKLSAAVS